MLALSFNAKNVAPNRVITLNETFSYNKSEESITQDIKTITLNVEQEYSMRVSDVDMIFMSSNIPVEFEVDTVKVGHGRMFCVEKTNGIQSYKIKNVRQNGFINSLQSTITYNYGTRTFNLNTTTTYQVVCEGVTYNVNQNYTVTHPTTNGAYYLYFVIENDAVSFESATELPQGQAYIPIATIVYNDDVNKSFIADNRNPSIAPLSTASIKIMVSK